MKATADVVIIGAGVLGAATAFELADRGLDVIVLERTLPGRQGSGTTAGNLHIQAIHPQRPGQDKPVDTRRLVPLQRETSLLWDALPDRLDRAVDIVRCGGLTVAETAAEVAALHDKHVWEREAGIPTEVLDGEAAREAMPALGETVKAATYNPWDGYADSLRTNPAYLAGAKARGARVFTHAPVTSLTRVGTTWEVVSAVGEFSAPYVVNAAGPWIQQVSALAGVELAMAPLAIQMHETVRAPRFMEHLVQHVGIGLSVKQVLSGSVVIGGGWPSGTLDLDGVTPVSEQSLAGNMADATRIVPRVAAHRLARVWPGPLAATPDEMPVIGEVPDAPGLLVMGGTYAFTFSPLWARTIGEIVQDGRPSLDLADLGPARLITAPTPERSHA